MSQIKSSHLSKWIEIDLSQLQQNLALIKKSIGSALLCLPIKSNAYGHGIVEIAQAADLADYFAVATLQEGVQLREAQITKPILVLGAFLQEEILDLARYDLEFSLSSHYKLKQIEQELEARDLIAKVHLKVETGMHRVGARPSTAYEIYNEAKQAQKIQLVGVYSHLANASPYQSDKTQKQLDVFDHFLKQLDTSELICHILNSGALPHHLHKPYDMVRPGILSFGFNACCLPKPFDQIKSLFSLKSKVSYFKVVDQGEGISYGHTYQTSKQTRIVTVPIGYGDGLRRELSNKGHVLIRGRKYPICGTICMDQLMVDIGEGEAYIGDEVVLIGAQGNQSITLDEVAKLCGTIPYEILCHFNHRLQRVYLQSPACV